MAKAAKKSKPAPAPKKAPKPAREPKAAKPSQPVQTDKFGLALAILVCLMVVANFLVWDMYGAKVDLSMLSRLTIEDYDAQVAQAKLIGYEARDTLGKLPGEVDVAVIDKGYADGVRLGDIFRVVGYPYSEEAPFIEFSVFDVGDTQSRAWIILGTRWSDRNQLNLDLGVLTKKFPLDSTFLQRKWTAQEARIKVEHRFPKDG